MKLRLLKALLLSNNHSQIPSSISRPHNPLPIRPPPLEFLDTSISASSSVIFKRWHFGHGRGHGPDHGGGRGSGEESERVFRLGLVADVGLAVGKAVTGYLSGSTAIIADAAHSLSDVVLSSVALLSFKAARAPKDKEHPYGHGKFETLGALGISCMLVGTAGGIAWHAIDILPGLFTATSEIASHSMTHEHTGHGHHHKIDLDHPVLALNMTILSIAIKEGLFWITKRAGEKEGSGLMKANAWHHRADAISSLVALIGVGGSILGVKFLDPLAGLVVSGLILKAGLETGYGSIMELVDAAIPQSELDPHRETILKVEGVKGCHRLRGRRAGSFLYLDVHIEVDPFSSVSTAHHVGEMVRRQIHDSHPEVAEVFIHIDPATIEVSPSVLQLKEKSMALNSETNARVDHNDIDNLISAIFLSNFQEKMTVQHITRHLLQGKILLDIEVSMPPDILIRDAMVMAESARKELLDTLSDVYQVNIQLRLLPQNQMFST